MAGADLRALAAKEKGDGLPSGDGPQVSLSSQTPSTGESYCAGHAKGAQCTASANPASRIVPQDRVCDRCIRSVWRSWFDEYA
jgi:hypothetical protein